MRALTQAFLTIWLPVALVAQPAAPRFERAECDFPLPAAYPRDLQRECGYVAVPEARERPNGRSFHLAVVLYRAREPDGSRPLLLIHGGPGGAGGTRFLWTELTFPLVRRRDVVTFDMRGVSRSEPRLCPDFDTSDKLDRPAQQEWEEAYRAAVRACVAKLDAEGFDRSAYGADINARDVIDLRRALGYASWDLYGVSYGGIVAQALMRFDPGGTHAVVLGSTVPMGARHAAEVALGHQQYVERVAAACAAQPACHRAFPDVAGDFDSLYRQFASTPVAAPLPGGSDTLLLNGERFLRTAGQIGLPPNVARLPLLLHELRVGDRETALRRLGASRGLSFWDPLAHLVWCNEYGSEYPRAVAAVRPRLRPAFRTIADDFREHCDLWLPHPSHELDVTPVASRIPTLVLHGEYDAMDVPATQRAMTVRLTRAHAYILPGETHANAPVGCHGLIVQQFLEHPDRAPDASCIQRMPPIRFRTTSGYSPIVTFVITPMPNTATPFAGTWEAPLGGGPDWTFALETDGSAVRGWELGLQLPIVDGHIAGSELRFSVRTGDGARTVSFTGTLQGDQLVFAREVVVAPGGSAGGRGLLGVAGPSTVTAQRVP